MPKARSYYGSVLSYVSASLFDRLPINGRRFDRLAINGNVIHPEVKYGDGLLAVEQYLHPGRNVLTGTLAAISPCSLLQESITLRMTGLQRPNRLVLSWRKIPGAARYDVQVWLIKAAPGQTITPDSEVNIATQTTGPRAMLDDAAMPAGTYQWRVAAVNAHGSLISRWMPAQTVTLN
jgi:hypothetical protein